MIDTISKGQLDNTNNENACNSPVLTEDDALLEMNENFNLDDYQVVRREFFAHLKEPSISFADCRIFVNAACLVKFPMANYAQLLINRKDRIMALRPCEEFAKDSFPWCNTNGGKRKTKSTTCKLLFAKLVALMDWNPEFRYKLLGRIVHANDEYLIAFDLSAAEVYKRVVDENNKTKKSRTPVYPADWQNQFGLPFYEHKKAMQINIFDGYAIYSVKEQIETDDIKGDLEDTNNEHSVKDVNNP